MGTDQGPIVRVRCTNTACANHRKVRVVRVPREGDVLAWPRYVCVRCLRDMQIVNKAMQTMREQET